MTPLELAREALAQWAAATPGPWEMESGHRDAWHRVNYIARGLNKGARFQVANIITTQGGNRQMKRDGAAIAAARTREPKLAEAVIALTAEVEKLSAEVERLKPRPVQIRGVDFSCEECCALEGSTRDGKGFMRCNRCGYPSP